MRFRVLFTRFSRIEWHFEVKNGVLFSKSSKTKCRTNRVTKIAHSSQLVSVDVKLRDQLFAAGLSPGAVTELPGWEAWLGKAELGRLQMSNISADTLAIGITPSLVRIAESVKEALESLTKEKRYELSRGEILLCGQGSGIQSLRQLLASYLGLRITPYDQTIHPSIYGATKVLKELKLLRKMATTRHK